MFHKVIMAFNNNNESKEALQLAKKLKLDNPEIELTVVHVSEEKKVETVTEPAENNINPPNIGSYTVDGLQIPPLSLDRTLSQKSVHEKVENSAEQALSNAKMELAALGENVEYVIVDGNPSDSLCRVAKRTAADLIILGQSKGKPGLKRFFTGSTIQEVIDNSPCTVLVVK
ncbi:universal stress protein [Bacillus massilinigeriensis]|uniref:universal stress protein n=1 Tax=Bacillus mediterraneensis TaxID=1805474 RepID=UPI001F3B1CC1|nr:universal stress protein [Bacillus mediterraneensis]